MNQPNQPTWTDAEIIEAFRRGGKWPDKAWEYMVKKWRGIYITAIKNKAKVSFVDEDEVDEAIQEMAPVFLKTVTNPNWPGLTHKLSTYFSDCVYYAWIRIRRRNSKLSLPGDENMPKPEDEMNEPKMESLEMLDQALHWLDEECKELLNLDYWEGYSNQEIADIFGLARRTVTNRLTICRNRLRDLIKKLFGF